MRIHRSALVRSLSLGFFVAAGSAVISSSALASSTLLRFDTTLGDIDVRMFDTATPASVANFLNYVTDSDFDGSFFHRAPLTRRVNSDGDLVDANGDLLPVDEFGQPDLTNSVIDTFVLQGGGFIYTDALGLSSVPTDAPVVNEPGLTNLPGTIAYAKQDGDPNSATSGFFFNTTNNVNNLDNQNGGFTVFARVVRGQSTLDAITALQITDLDPAPDPTPENPFPVNPPTFDNVPVILPDTAAGLDDNLVFVNSVSVLALPDGDYNFDGVVDAADFTVWRNQNGASLRIADHAIDPTLSTEMGADGNGDGVVDAADYLIWRDAAGILVGDLNGDGSVTNGDINAFVQALTDPAGYAAAFPGLDPDVLGDFTGDAALTNGDIAGFVDALTGGGAGSVPEPASLVLLGVGGLMEARRRR